MPLRYGSGGTYHFGAACTWVAYGDGSSSMTVYDDLEAELEALGIP